MIMSQGSKENKSKAKNKLKHTSEIIFLAKLEAQLFYFFFSFLNKITPSSLYGYMFSTQNMIFTLSNIDIPLKIARKHIFAGLISY